MTYEFYIMFHKAAFLQHFTNITIHIVIDFYMNQQIVHNVAF